MKKTIKKIPKKNANVAKIEKPSKLEQTNNINTDKNTDNEFDLEDLDLAEGLNYDDFDDDLYQEIDDDLEGINSEDSLDLPNEDDYNNLYESMANTAIPVLASFFDYDGQNVAELLTQIRDSIDSNSKCILRIAQEIRSLHEKYDMVNIKNDTENKENPTI